MSEIPGGTPAIPKGACLFWQSFVHVADIKPRMDGCQVSETFHVLSHVASLGIGQYKLGTGECMEGMFDRRIAYYLTLVCST